VPEALVWLFALVPAAALVREHQRAHATRERLNRCLHELRRPLQALALSGGADGPRRATLTASQPGLVELAIAALADLEGTVNGGRRAVEKRLVSARELVASARKRWREAAERSGAPLTVYWDAGPALVVGDPGRIAQALDNLIVNAIGHGGPPFILTASIVTGRVRITLSDGGDGAKAAAGGDRRPTRSGLRGHGLSVVDEVAREHGGRFALRHSPQGAVAALELPLAGPDAAIAA
jgi:signal transduction histidine kinase